MNAEINGIHMGFESHGEGPVLVLIHGFGLNRSIWREMTVAYLQECRVILPDVRGHGESEASDGVYPMSLLADDLAALLDHLEVEKAVVAGHSMGGYITLAFAEGHSERLAGIGLVTTRAEADPPDQAAGRYQLAEEVAKKGSAVLAESLAPRLSDDPQIVAQMHTLISNTAPQGIIGVSKGMAQRPDRRGFLKEIALPSLVAAGRDDQIIDHAQAEEMAALLPEGVFLSLPECGHMPMLEAPEPLAQGLSTLVKRALG
jgi:pimeloyl-ACP methyl ester carboxylesterase